MAIRNPKFDDNSPMAPPNILWICTDQQRSDSLGCAGNAYARTPNLDSMATSGTRFTRHNTPMQICSPSRATMFTGLYPRHHQLIMNGMALDPNIPTLTGMLANSGYRTHSVGKQHLQPLLAPANRLMPDSRAFWDSAESDGWTGPYYGFQTLDLLLGESDTAAAAGHYANWLKKHHPQAVKLLDVVQALEPPPSDLDEIWRSAMPSEYHYNTWISNNAVSFIDRHDDPDIPFFLFVSYPDPHHPFAPPADYADRYDPDDMPLPHCEPDELANMPSYYGELYPKGEGFRQLYWSARQDLEAGSMITTEDVSDESMRRAIAYTYGMIEMIDDGIGCILASLEQRGLKENTVILFTSDHGELLGSHGLLHKGPPPYRQLTEISLLMSGPGIPAESTVDAMTNHIDLAPTFLDIAGVSANDVQFDGASFGPLITGEGGSVREYDFGEFHPSARPEIYNQTIRTHQYRFTIYPQNPRWGELFDLHTDPNEHHNLFSDTSMGAVKNELYRLLASEFPPQTSVDNEWLCKW